MRPVADLLPYAQNARLHSDEQIQKIARSIREFGFNNPILIDAKGEIIAGHGRLLAAHVLGLIAAETTGRICYAMELDPAYVDVCVERWETFTGEKARR